MNRRNFLKMLQVSALVFGPLKARLAVPSGKGTGFVYDDLFLEYWLEEGHPESPDRLRSIMKTMEQSGLLQYLSRIQPKKDILQELALIHTTEHFQLHSKFWLQKILVVQLTIDKNRPVIELKRVIMGLNRLFSSLYSLS